MFIRKPRHVNGEAKEMRQNIIFDRLGVICGADVIGRIPILWAAPMLTLHQLTTYPVVPGLKKYSRLRRKTVGVRV